MQHEAIDGIVVRVKDTGEGNRYLSVLTAEKGRISILSKGSRSIKGGMTAISQLYTYGNFEYYKRGDFNILKGGTPIQPFYSLSFDIDRMNLAAYLCDLATELSDEGEPAEDLLQLLLNGLYATGRDLYPQEIIKGAVELRMAALSGYAPDLSGCENCGNNEGDLYYLNVMNGSLKCEDCNKKKSFFKKIDDYNEIREADVVCPISASVLAAMRYCLGASLKRIFSFELQDQEDLRMFSKVAEVYLLSHLGRGFDSLNFYHSLHKTN